MQNCTGDDYAQVIVVADGFVQIMTGGAHNATALELCEATRKTWWIAGHSNNDKDNDGSDDDSKRLETLLVAVKQTWSLNYKGCFNCNNKDHKSAYFPNKNEKGGLEKARAAHETSIKKSKSKCGHCGAPDHA
jgi:hypothetical protein